MAEPESTFRDRISTMNDAGRRAWVYVNKPKGKLHTYRIIVSIVLLTLLFSGPFIKIGGNPLLLMNIIERKFIIFGNVFWPQDFHLFVIFMITFIVALVLFTVIYGRIWCGWACPQTIFMEMVFRKIEFWLEGNAHEQRKLNDGPVDFEKIWKKTLKHFLFILLSFLITHTFLSYIVGAERVALLLKEGPVAHPGGFIPMVLFTGAFYFVFAKFREQVCSIVCPYGRLQGVLLDSNSLVVAYDYKRGEPRGKLSKQEVRSETGKGDCISCGSCVRVCPAGIDIKNGTQLECINCTACIDACNSVMKKVGFKPGLIRFASENEISKGQKFGWNARVIAYSVVLFILIGILGFVITLRKEFEATILRVPGTLFQVMEDGEITNLYNINLVNKTDRDMPVEIRILSHKGTIKLIGQPLYLPGEKMGTGVFLVYLPANVVNTHSLQVTFGVYSNEKLIEKIETTFVGPNINP